MAVVSRPLQGISFNNRKYDMKKILLILAVLFSVYTYGQTSCEINNTTLLLDTANIAGLTGDDTTIYFGLPQVNKGYAIQVVVTDTVETEALGVYLKASIDGGNTYTVIGDSASIAVTTFPQGVFFTGTYWPYGTGAVMINKNGATDGDIKIYVRVK